MIHFPGITVTGGHGGLIVFRHGPIGEFSDLDCLITSFSRETADSPRRTKQKNIRVMGRSNSYAGSAHAGNGWPDFSVVMR
jgi:hypothetical protein